MYKDTGFLLEECSYVLNFSQETPLLTDFNEFVESLSWPHMKEDSVTKKVQVRVVASHHWWALHKDFEISKMTGRPVDVMSSPEMPLACVPLSISRHPPLLPVDMDKAHRVQNMLETTWF